LAFLTVTLVDVGGVSVLVLLLLRDIAMAMLFMDGLHVDEEENKENGLMVVLMVKKKRRRVAVRAQSQLKPRSGRPF
jgi:hypothetical protein